MKPFVRKVLPMKQLLLNLIVLKLHNVEGQVYLQGRSNASFIYSLVAFTDNGGGKLLPWPKKKMRQPNHDEERKSVRRAKIAFSSCVLGADCS